MRSVILIVNVHLGLLYRLSCCAIAGVISTPQDGDASWIRLNPDLLGMAVRGCTHQNIVEGNT